MPVKLSVYRNKEGTVTRTETCHTGDDGLLFISIFGGKDIAMSSGKLCHYDLIVDRDGISDFVSLTSRLNRKWSHTKK